MLLTTTCSEALPVGSLGVVSERSVRRTARRGSHRSLHVFTVTGGDVIGNQPSVVSRRLTWRGEPPVVNASTWPQGPDRLAPRFNSQRALTEPLLSQAFRLCLGESLHRPWRS